MTINIALATGDLLRWILSRDKYGAFSPKG